MGEAKRKREDGARTCSTCKGKGKVPDPEGETFAGLPLTVLCPDCGGDTAFEGAYDAEGS